MTRTKKFPNASVLSIIARQLTGGTNDVLFISLKPIPDFYESKKVFWYEGNGRKGIAVNIWKKWDIKHWFACGLDTDMSRIYDHILLTKSYDIEGKHMIFNLPEFDKHIYKPDPFVDRNQRETERLVANDISHFPQPFLEKNNLAMLTGYKKATSGISPLFPMGYYEENEIFKLLDKKVFGIKDTRKPYLTFHGISDKGIKAKLAGMTGFYQENFAVDKEYKAVLANKNGGEKAGAIINTNTGVFNVASEDQTGKGSVSILIDDLASKKVDYTLIKDIKFSVDIASGTVNDAYGRNHMQIPGKKNRPNEFQPLTWQREVYANTEDGNIVLSDTMKTLFDYLGPSILIADPYYINGLKLDQNTKQFSLTPCQVSFMNALAYSAATGGVTELTILGYNGRANQHSEKDKSLPETTTEQRFDRYKSFFIDFIAKNGLHAYLKPTSINFQNAHQDFHNRFWFAMSEDKTKLEKCIIVTTSIGNMFEVDFLPVTDPAQLMQITMKYMNLFKLSDNELTI